ncbi:outer membrane lipoprotein LolB [Neisseriaceae bacterium ESL0693]|nr:outer membrane lipoprotein LolB [Neisseriaceae bacterium ESL0693]
MLFKRFIMPLLGILMIFSSGCAQLQQKPDASSATWPAAPEPLTEGFNSSGRLAVKDYGKGSYANFTWQNEGEIQSIDVKTPLGNSVGQLCQDKQGVIARDSHGQIMQADSIASLSQDLLGVALPFEYLNQWVQGYRINHEAYEIQSEDRLYQLGWRIQRQLRPDGQTPRMIRLINQQFDIKLLFDEYYPASTKASGDCQLRHQIGL